MNFMCSKHLNELYDNPSYAKVIWAKLVSQARQQLKKKDWQKTIMFYGNALDAAQVSLEANNDTGFKSVNRYIKTASELISIIRYSGYPFDVSIIVEVVRHNLIKQLYPANIELLIRSLTHVAYNDLPSIKKKVHELNALDDLPIERNQL